MIGWMDWLSGCKTQKIGVHGFESHWDRFSYQFSDLDPESKTGFWKCWGGNLVPPFQFAALFFSCARENCALSEYPSSVNWYNDIFETRARFWPGSPRKMTKK